MDSTPASHRAVLVFALGDGKLQVHHKHRIFSIAARTQTYSAVVPPLSQLDAANAPVLFEQLESLDLMDKSKTQIEGKSRIGLVGGGQLHQLIAAVATHVPIDVISISEDAILSQTSSIEKLSSLIVCFDSPKPALLSKINRACHSLRLPWVPAYLDLAGPVVGPFVRPFESACWECFCLRRQAATSRWTEMLAYWNFLDNQSFSFVVPNEATESDCLIAATLACNSVLEELAGNISNARNKMIEVDVSREVTESHPVIRVPSCETCGDTSVLGHIL